MSKLKLSLKLACASVLAIGASSADAALVDRGGGLIYDDVLDVTWLQDAGLSSSSSFVNRPGGGMTWSAANAWAASLVYHDSIRNVDYDDWRLPYTRLSNGNQCPIGACPIGSSEMSFMFYSNLGGVQGQSIATTHNSNYSLFSNIYLDQPYWSTDLPLGGDTAWAFWFGGTPPAGGLDFLSFVDNFGAYRAWAVRDGDVAAVPVPAAIWLMLGSLTSLGAVARRRVS